MKPRIVTPEDTQRAAEASSGASRRKLERTLAVIILALMAEGVVLGGLGIAVMARSLTR